MFSFGDTLLNLTYYRVYGSSSNNSPIDEKVLPWDFEIVIEKAGLTENYYFFKIENQMVYFHLMN